jgi:hypothetical protein
MYACMWKLDEQAVRTDLAESYAADLAADLPAH